MLFVIVCLLCVCGCVCFNCYVNVACVFSFIFAFASLVKNDRCVKIGLEGV